MSTSLERLINCRIRTSSAYMRRRWSLRGGQAKVFVAQKLKSFNVSRDPGDGWRRSDSGETREGTKASKTILGKDALLPYQKEK